MKLKQEDITEPIEMLRHYVCLQFEAHLRGDEDNYNALEAKILEVEKFI